MAKPEKSKSGFVIKLSCETVQKLSEEDVLAKRKNEVDPTEKINDVNLKDPDFNLALESNENSESNSSKLSPEKNKNQKSGDEQVETKDSGDSPDSSWGAYAPYITYEGEEAIYTDPSTQQKYTWNKASNSWDLQAGQTEAPGRVYSYEDDTHIYTESDGSKCFWDIEKKAWLPKVDDDFLAKYQMSYGFIDNTTKVTDKEPEKKKEDKKSDPTAVKRKSEPQWFQVSDTENTKVYVSNLPEDINEEEFVALMQKCGLVERDLSTQKMKVKLYKDKEHDCFKGDALCTYIKIESVELALNLIDGMEYKGHKLKVERASFQLKGNYDPSLKPKKRKKKELEKLKKMQQKLFDWRPEKFIGERSKHERVVIVKNLFHPTDFDKEVQLILDYQQDLREECAKCGDVRKVVLYDRHPEGVAQITMKEPEQADAVVQLINGRWFGKKQITAEIWDGKTKYKIAETDADLNKRIDKWDKFLEGEDKSAATAPLAEDKSADTAPQALDKTVDTAPQAVDKTADTAPQAVDKTADTAPQAVDQSVATAPQVLPQAECEEVAVSNKEK